MIEEIPPFEPRAPWWGGDLQTVRNKLIGAKFELPGDSQRVRLAMADGSGDRLAAMLDTPDQQNGDPLVVLIHGLTGCEDSIFVRASAAFHLRRGRRVLRLNLRGAGPSRATCAGHYHAGSEADIRDALAALPEDQLSDGLVLVGFSLGGNVLLRFLAAHGDELPVRGAVSVSSPIEPAQAARRIMARRNAVYHFWLLRRMKNETTAEGAKITPEERDAIERAETIYEFDRDFVAARLGFSGADEYYAEMAGARAVQDIRLPLVMIHARNDPWIPSDPYERLAEKRPTNAHLVLTDGGGHVGFHGRGDADPWHDQCADEFIKSL